MKKQILFIAFALVFGSISAIAQRQPSTPIRHYLVSLKQSIADLDKKLTGDSDKAASTSKDLTVTKVEDLIGGAGMETRVAIQHDTRRSGDLAELHDKSDDVYYVLKGKATLELGGIMDDPKETSAGSGEWKSKTVTGSKMVEIKEGDMVMVPRGTPHRRIVTGKGFSMILIKIYEDPLPK